MSSNVTVNNKVFSIPDQGETPPYGEDLTAFFKEVATVLGTVSGSNDILTTTFSLTNNQSSAANITGLNFNTSQVRAATIKYVIRRTTSDPLTYQESGTIECDFDGSTFTISVDSLGDSTGVTLSATNSGQLQYTSSNLANHSASVITFKATTIDV